MTSVPEEKNVWSRHYAALMEYYKEHGTCNVPASFIRYECDLIGWNIDGSNYHYNASLGNWLYNQRKAKKYENTDISSAEQEAELQLLVTEGNYYSLNN